MSKIGDKEMNEMDSDSDDGFDVDYIYAEGEREKETEQEQKQMTNKMINGRSRITMKSRINRYEVHSASYFVLIIFSSHNVSHKHRIDCWRILYGVCCPRCLEATEGEGARVWRRCSTVSCPCPLHPHTERMVRSTTSPP